MGLNDNARNAMLNQLGTLITFASLHTADPGTTGTSEVSGGSPAYARKAIAWAAAAASSMAKTATNPVFDVPGAVTITHVGFWSAVTAGTFYGWGDITDETFGGQGTYTLTAATISAT